MNLRFFRVGRVLAVAALAAVLTFGTGVPVQGETLPLDPKNSTLTFSGESFLHDFHGEAKGFTGSAELDVSATPPVQKAVMRFKTAELTTFNKSRDQKMWDWLKVSAHPDATFALESVKLLEGDIQKANANRPAKFTVSGTLTLNGVKQPIGGSALGWRDRDRLIVSGDTVIDTLKHALPQIRETFMTVGTNVKTSYRFSFILPPEYALK